MSLSLPQRPRRNRISASRRDMVCEIRLSPGDLILPLFVHDGEVDDPIDSLPGCYRLTLPGLVRTAQEATALGIPAIALFPVIPERAKTSDAAEAWNDAGLVPRAVAALKENCPGLTVITDVALDPYNSDGHDGLVERMPDSSLRVLNDETVECLCKQALCHAKAGADVVAPSDMMDGRVGAIRSALDSAGHTEVSILSYAAKFASAFYGPFRGALGSAPKEGDKKTYQLDPANAREALREIALDEAEGADMLMVKPAGPFLDVVFRARQATHLPLAAYQVSGEYLMLKSAAAVGWLNEKAAVLESLLGIRRAGADMILTYFAMDAARWLREEAGA